MMGRAMQITFKAVLRPPWGAGPGEGRSWGGETAAEAHICC